MKSMCGTEKVAHDDRMTTPVLKLETLEMNQTKPEIEPVTEKNNGSILENDTKTFTWQEIAQMFDVCLMRFVGIVVFLCSFICCMILIVQYNS